MRSDRAGHGLPPLRSVTRLEALEAPPYTSGALGPEAAPSRLGAN
jgi:hypothetical protein